MRAGAQLASRKIASEAGRSWPFRRWPRICREDLAEAAATGTRKELVQQLARVDLLVIGETDTKRGRERSVRLVSNTFPSISASRRVTAKDGGPLPELQAPDQGTDAVAHNLQLVDDRRCRCR